MTRVKGTINPYPFAQYPPFLTRTVKAVTLGTTPTLIVSARGSRIICMIYNNSQVNIYIGDANVTINNGIPVARGANYVNEGWTGAIYGIVATGTADVRVEEN